MTTFAARPWHPKSMMNQVQTAQEGPERRRAWTTHAVKGTTSSDFGEPSLLRRCVWLERPDDVADHGS